MLKVKIEILQDMCSIPEHTCNYPWYFFFCPLHIYTDNLIHSFILYSLVGSFIHSFIHLSLHCIRIFGLQVVKHSTKIALRNKGHLLTHNKMS